MVDTSGMRRRSLRAEQTKAEAKLWRALRNRQLDGFKFRRQFPIDRFFADFVCIDAKLVIELDGGQHAQQIVYDTERTTLLEGAGFVVLRFWNNDVLLNLDGVMETIQRALHSGSTG
jgi:very-short-patch-repair endonuclease